MDSDYFALELCYFRVLMFVIAIPIIGPPIGAVSVPLRQPEIRGPEHKRTQSKANSLCSSGKQEMAVGQRGHGLFV